MFTAGESLGQYTIIELIAQGGMGDIYLANDMILDRLVAVKCLSAKLTCDHVFIERFYREAKATASVVNNNVVAIHDLSKEGDVPFFVMEYIEGETLSQRIKRLSRLSPIEAIPIIKQAAQGLEAALESGLIHRDVKPSNIIINKKGVAKLTDFGLVMALDDTSRITHSDMILGSPHYISPEQAKGEEKIDFRSDIYSLGISLYHALSGTLPFNASTPMGIMLRHVNDPLPPLNQTTEGIDPEVVNLVHKMVEKKREDRFQSYEELLEALNLCLSTCDNRANTCDTNSGSLSSKGKTINSSAAIKAGGESHPPITDTELHSAPTLATASKIEPGTTSPLKSLGITKKQKLPLPDGYLELGGLTGTLWSVYTNPGKAFKKLARGKLNVKIPLIAAILCLTVLYFIIPMGRTPEQTKLWYKGYSAFLLTDLLLILPLYIFSQKDKGYKSAFVAAINLLLFSWIAQIWFAARWLFLLAFPTPWIAYCGLEHLLELRGSRLQLTWLACLFLFIIRTLIAIGCVK
jgi:serine/threonine protein kinase